MTSACTCRYCAVPETKAEPAAVTPMPDLPDAPRRFLVHTICGPQDCTLHPDGRITMRAGGQLWRCALGVEDMFSPDEPAGTNFSRCRIDWDLSDDDVARAMQALPEQHQADLFATPATEEASA